LHQFEVDFKECGASKSLRGENRLKTTDEKISTAFRLPNNLLQIIDRWCFENDFTRSQFFRHAITDKVKNLLQQQQQHQLQQQPQSYNSKVQARQQQPQQWSQESYDRLLKR
jgi:hypothetical protein